MAKACSTTVPATVSERANELESRVRDWSLADAGYGAAVGTGSARQQLTAFRINRDRVAGLRWATCGARRRGFTQVDVGVGDNGSWRRAHRRVHVGIHLPRIAARPIPTHSTSIAHRPHVPPPTAR